MPDSYRFVWTVLDVDDSNHNWNLQADVLCTPLYSIQIFLVSIVEAFLVHGVIWGPINICPETGWKDTFHNRTTMSRGNFRFKASEPSQFPVLSGASEIPNQVFKIRVKLMAGWWFGTSILFSHILGIIIPIDVHIFQRGSNHQPDGISSSFSEPHAGHASTGCDLTHHDSPHLWSPSSRPEPQWTKKNALFSICFVISWYLLDLLAVIHRAPLGPKVETFSCDLFSIVFLLNLDIRRPSQYRMEFFWRFSLDAITDISPPRPCKV